VASKRKILETAQKQVQKGALDKALQEYSSLLELDPRDSNALLKIGDIQLRLGQREEAIATYLKVAEQFKHDEFDPKAVAVYKQVLKIDPKRSAVYVPLAELYQRLGLVAEALSAFQAAADGYKREGHEKKALDLLRRTAELDPSNLKSRLKIAGLLSESGLREEAAGEYEDIAAEVLAKGEKERAVELCQKALELEPQRMRALLVLAGAHAQAGRGEPAETAARQALESHPNAPEPREFLIDFFRTANRQSEVYQLQLELARVYRNRGDEDRARELVQTLPSEFVGEEWAAAKAEEAGSPLGALGPEMDEPLVQDEEATAPPAEAVAEAGEALFGTIEEAAETEEETAAEAEGSLPESEEMLVEVVPPAVSETLFAVSSEPVAAPEVFSETTPEPPVEITSTEPPAQLLVPFRQVEEELEEAELLFQQSQYAEAGDRYRKILGLLPGHPRALLRLGELAALCSSETETAGEAVGIAPLAGAEDDTTLNLACAEIAAGGISETPAARSCEDDGLDDVPRVPLARESAPKAIVPKHVTEAEWSETDLASTLAIAAGDAPSVRAETAVDERKEALEPFAAEAATFVSPPPAAEAPVKIPDEAEHGTFDLAAELSRALETPQSEKRRAPSTPDDGLQEIFREFKQGVSRALGEGDAETRYDLGIAYKEMGLLEDAVSEFQLAMASEMRRIDCLHMLGLCSLELERPLDAVAYLEQALSAPSIPAVQEVALRFDLGRAFEAAGDAGNALDAYRMVAAIDPEFRSVREDLVRLESSFGEVPSEAEAGAETFESFDDLIAEITATERGEPGNSPDEKPPSGSPTRRRRKISFG